ncbi:MAG: hypothetical protein B6I20_11935 [Bacteroidetes bacterium 4572_117]|nr:MAG: hypothetical protein B6I20_11935 [Bacteroidetes bacterium 4572_117]
MKKFRFLSLATAVIFFLVLIIACGNNEKTEETDEQNTDQTEETVENNTTDKTTLDLLAGEQIYKDNCMVCHLENGEGVAGTFPPLAKSDYLLGDKNRAILQTLVGSKEPIMVNGLEYTGGVMTIVELEDQQTADVVNYILNSWGNKGGTVTATDVKAVRPIE